ncbi:MAG TPA: carbonic anhydrase [Candidatus Acidoferrum sp.]|nr:carbonic anhydrase [Candidatus Acidoferrum sp.]
MNYDRRAFLLQASAGLALSSAAPGIAVAAGGSPPLDAKGALAALMAGNARFDADKATCPPLTARRLEVAHGQNPFAIILSCADSRVPVETVFDQIPGNIFGVRVAGNFIEPAGLGSFEYAIAELNVPLILVLGHSKCGAVDATLAYLEKGEKFPGKIQYLVDSIAPGVKGSHDLASAIEANVRANVVNTKKQSSIVANAVTAGKLMIVGGVYDLESGKVTLLS